MREEGKKERNLIRTYKKKKVLLHVNWRYLNNITWVQPLVLSLLPVAINLHETEKEFLHKCCFTAKAILLLFLLNPVAVWKYLSLVRKRFRKQLTCKVCCYVFQILLAMKIVLSILRIFYDKWSLWFFFFFVCLRKSVGQLENTFERDRNSTTTKISGRIYY